MGLFVRDNKGLKTSDIKIISPAVLSSGPHGFKPSNEVLKRPSTAQGRAAPRTLRKVPRKRSLASLLSIAPPAPDTRWPRFGSAASLSRVFKHSNWKRRAVANDDVQLFSEQEKITFVAKNTFTVRHRRKHHPYPSQVAPYMQAYDRILLENDIYTETLVRRINPNGSPSFHDYGKKHPSDVLDLGCGRGQWVVEAATAWKSSRVTGFDLMDIAIRTPGLEKSVTDRIRWVRGNFVQFDLPFKDNSFDLVRMANLTLCVPFEKWIPIFSEARRVLKPKGRLEVIDDMIHFPYLTPLPPRFPSTPKTSSGKSGFASSFENGSHKDSSSDADSVITLTEGSEHVTDIPEHITRSHQLLSSSRSLEVVFRKMLETFGIHFRPSIFLLGMMDLVFGRSHSRRTHFLTLALPSDEEAVCVEPEIEESREKKSIWPNITIVWDDKKKKAQEVQAKLKGSKSSRSSSNASVTTLVHLSHETKITAKATHCLGVGASSGAQTRAPGLVLFPSTFIPMSHNELEMHTSKFVHVVLGCKSAIFDYVSKFKDENGECFLGDDELNELFWEYECFRRKRLNWPNPPDLKSFPLAESWCEYPESCASEPSSIFGRNRSGSRTKPSKNVPRYKFDESRHVRTFRVYEAVKTL